jgi:hypothetical protein
MSYAMVYLWFVIRQSQPMDRTFSPPSAIVSDTMNLYLEYSQRLKTLKVFWILIGLAI